MTVCRFCKNSLTQEFVDLVAAPPSNSFIKEEQLHDPEPYYPLKLFVCEKCFLVQIDEFKSAGDIFSSDYVYFSSFSKSWLEHCSRYADQVTARFSLTSSSRVVEVASNDGYLLQFFHKKGIQVLGIEPTQGTANAAIAKGIETVVRFFGSECAEDLVKLKGKADLMAGNNVLAHVPDINDFVKGIKIMLAEKGVFTGEFPHLRRLVEQNQFDTIYHEHFSYYSFTTIRKIFAAQGLRLFDVEELPTHGGSLRIYADHGGVHEVSDRVQKMLAEEEALGMTQLPYYQNFQASVNKVKNELLTFLLEKQRVGESVAAYGAAAKGSTLLNYCGIKPDLIEFVVDANPHKQGRYMPGSRLPVKAESELRAKKPKYVLILPWNLKTEITAQLSYIREWGGQFVVPIPHLQVF